MARSGRELPPIVVELLSKAVDSFEKLEIVLHLHGVDGVATAVEIAAAIAVRRMYGWMAIARFAIIGHRFDKSTPVFWPMMQVAMFAGFLTSYPVNLMLIRRGLKEAM